MMVSETTLEDEHVQVMMDKWEDEDNLLDLNEKSDKTTFIVYIKVEGVLVFTVKSLRPFRHSSLP